MPSTWRDCTRQSVGSCRGGPELAEIGFYACPSRGFGGSLGRLMRFGSVCWTGNLGYNRVAFHAALKNQRGAHAHTAHQDDQVRIKFGLHFCLGIITERWHEHLVDRFVGL